MLTKLYLDTTNPKLSFGQLFSASIMPALLFSVIFHTLVYASFVNLVTFIFIGKILGAGINVRLVTALLLIMFFGFFARFVHVKDIYEAYGRDAKKTREHLDNLYIGWIFIS